LYDLLYSYRNTVHPDNYNDDTLKNEAEEKFKEISKLLDQLSNFIEIERLRKNPSEIIPYQKDYENVRSKQDILLKEQEIEKLKLDIRLLKYRNRDLRKELKALGIEKLDEKTDELIALYKPTNKNLISLGISAFLFLISGILTNIENIAIQIAKYSPVSKEKINMVIFIIFVIILIVYLKKYFEEMYIQKISKKIRVPKFIKKFFDCLINNNISNEFSESDVYDFLSKELTPQKMMIKLLTRIFAIYNDITIDVLKDLFIFNLLNKQLIEVSSAENLDRKFRIKKGFNYFDEED